METSSRETPNCTELINRGVKLLHLGQRQAARSLFAQAVRLDPNSASAWLWLSRSVDDERQRQDCLDRVRQLDQEKQLDLTKQLGRNQDANTDDLAPASAAESRDLETSSVTKERTSRARRRRRLATFAALVALIAILAYVATTRLNWQATRAQIGLGSAVGRNPLEASGVIRAEEASIASEYGGQIETILVQEGQAVTTNQALVRLDTALLDAQIEAARAAIALAEARLAQARAGARPGQIAVAEAELAQAQAARVAAVQAVSDTSALVRNPQAIRMQIAVLEAQIEADKHRLAEKLALKDAAEIGKEQFKDAQDKIRDAGGPGRHSVPVPGVPGAFYEYTVPSLPLEAHLAPNYWWQAWVGVNATAAQKEGLEASLAHLYAQRDHPQDLKAQADEALAALAQVEARVLVAQAQVDALKAGATLEQIAALEARAEQARTALESLASQRALMEIHAPMDGIVLSLTIHEGEVAAPGAPIVTIADLTRTRLTVYVPETRVGRIGLGQAVQVTVDSFPDRTFQGTVTHIADSAEFTPRNVATQEERINLVFAVQVGLDNQAGTLKPGMPADARFEK